MQISDHEKYLNVTQILMRIEDVFEYYTNFDAMT